jgi:hypothetical protein
MTDLTWLGDLANFVTVAGGASAVTGYSVNRWINRRGLLKLDGWRLKQLPGRWRGKIYQHLPVDPSVVGDGEACFQYDLDIDFSVIGRKLVEGAATISGTIPPRGSIDAVGFVDKFAMRGGLVYDDFLKMDYNQRQADAIHFGSALFLLSAGREDMPGRFVGFGNILRQVVSGHIVEFRKTTSSPNLPAHLRTKNLSRL